MTSAPPIATQPKSNAWHSQSAKEVPALVISAALGEVMRCGNVDDAYRMFPAMGM